MSPVFVVGCPRSGTHFAAELFRNTLHYSSWHCDDVGKASGDSFLGFSKWHGFPVNTECLVAHRQQLAERCKAPDVYVESNCYLSLLTRELHEAFACRFVLLVREPADVVNSLFVKGHSAGRCIAQTPERTLPGRGSPIVHESFIWAPKCRKMSRTGSQNPRFATSRSISLPLNRI